MYVIRIRRGTLEEWTNENPILIDGELGFETDTRALKIGDGVTPWSDLTYLMNPQGLTGFDIKVLGVVPDFASLPTDAETNDLYITDDNDRGWVWNGTAWVDVGVLQGPPGQDGATGPQGPKGDTGDAGIWWSGTQVEYDAISTKDPDTLYVVIG